MHKLLKLQHHKHTGKKLHHRHTSFRGLTIVFASALFSIFILNNNVAALNYDVTAKVSASIPNQPSQITSPVNGTVVGDSSLAIRGKCQVLNTTNFVIIERAGQSIGSTNCQSNGTFSLRVNLLSGMNSLVPRSLNVTNDYGPNGSAVTVTYSPIANDIQTKTLFLNSKQNGLVFTINKKMRLDLSFGGGEQPYEIVISWGDGDKDNIVSQIEGTTVLYHEYLKNEIYQIEAKLIDKSGNIVILNIGALSTQQDPPRLFGAIQSSGGSGNSNILARYALVGLSATGLTLAGFWIFTTAPLKAPWLLNTWRRHHFR
ncbi:MAG: hypothetical protein AAB459_01610 [Patescibacteria group bacterium]